MLHYLKKSSGLKGGWGFQNSPPLRYFLGKRPQLVGDPQSPKYCDGPLRRSAKRDARTQLLMRQMLDWLKQNKEWVFSGVGVAVLAAIFGLIKSRSGALLLGRPLRVADPPAVSPPVKSTVSKSPKKEGLYSFSNALRGFSSGGMDLSLLRSRAGISLLMIPGRGRAVTGGRNTGPHGGCHTCDRGMVSTRMHEGHRISE